MHLPFADWFPSEEVIQKLNWLYDDLVQEEARKAETEYRRKLKAIDDQYKHELEAAIKHDTKAFING